MSIANETVFANVKEFVKREAERIMAVRLEERPYDSLKSQ